MVRASGYDLLLTPTLGEPPVPLGTFQTPEEPMLGFIRAATFVPYTPLDNMTGSPAISLPLFWNDANLPVGVQLQGAYGREDLLLRVAAQLEQAQPWATARTAGACLTVAVVVAGGQGFYGDTPTAVDALLAEGVDYLCLEALAELTLAILQKDRQRDESRGYTRDLPAYLARALPFVADGRTKIITNAGGINPAAAAHAAIETARQLGVTGITIATVLGDDVLTRLDRLHDEEGQPLRPPRHRRGVRNVSRGAAVRGRVPRRAADRGRAGTGRRRRDHRPGRRRVAVPRATRARTRLGVGRLGPARRRHPRRPPARVLGPEHRRQLLR